MVALTESRQTGRPTNWPTQWLPRYDKFRKKARHAAASKLVVEPGIYLRRGGIRARITLPSVLRRIKTEARPGRPASGKPSRASLDGKKETSSLVASGIH